MVLRIHNHSSVTINTLLFLIFSILYLHTALALQKSTTAINLNSLIDFLSTNILLPILTLTTSVTIFQGKKISIQLLFLTTAIFIFLLGQLVWIDFGRILFFMFLTYVLFYALFLDLWPQEFRRAIYNPLYFTGTLLSPPPVSFPVEIEILTKEHQFSQPFKGVLSNWDHNSAFILLNSPSAKKLAGKTVRIQIPFKGTTFTPVGEVATSVPAIQGVGISFKTQQTFLNDEPLDLHSFKHSWEQLYTLFSDMAYLPSLWK
jgi:hypothetical protein